MVYCLNVIGLFIEFLFFIYLFIYLVSKVKGVSKISNSLDWKSKVAEMLLNIVILIAEVGK